MSTSNDRHNTDEESAEMCHLTWGRIGLLPHTKLAIILMHGKVYIVHMPKFFKVIQKI